MIEYISNRLYDDVNLRFERKVRKPDLRNPSYINYYKHCRDTRSPSQLANHQSNDLQPKSFLIASFRIGIFGKARQLKKKKRC